VVPAPARRQHPVRRKPPKKYQDIYPLNFETSDWQGLWDELRAVFEFWIGHGVRVFRVDNPHTKALPFWEWCIGSLRQDHPDVIFLAEAFTRPHIMYSLAKAGFTQSYTYFTWRTEKAELEAYFEEITQPPVSDFFTPNVWPNTPDILHASLQTGGRAAFMQRLILATTLAANYGIYGPPTNSAKTCPPSREARSTSTARSIRFATGIAPPALAGSARHAPQPYPPRESRAAKRPLPALSSRRQPADPLLLENIVEHGRQASQRHPRRRQPRSAQRAGRLDRPRPEATRHRP